MKYQSRARIISSDFIEFGVEDLKTDFIHQITDDVREEEMFIYINLPFPSSTVLDFIKDLKSGSVSNNQEVHQLKSLLGYKESEPNVDMSLEINEGDDSNAADETQYLIKVEIENISFISNQGDDLENTLMELNNDDDTSVMNESLPNNEVDISTINDTIIPTVTDETEQETVNLCNGDQEEANRDMDTSHTAENFQEDNQIVEDDIYDKTVAHCNFTEINDELHNLTIESEVEKSTTECVEESCVKSVSVKVVTTRVPLIKDLNKRKRKRGQ